MKTASDSKSDNLPPLILASGSPRRRELLEQAGYVFTVVSANEDVECGVCSESGPAGLVTELAYRKAAAVRKQLLSEKGSHSLDPRTIVLAADTVADLDGFVLGKPRDESHARAMLSQLSGRDHRVLTGVCLWPLFPPLPPGEGRGEGTPSQAPKSPLPPRLLSFARELRKNETDAEKLMWSLLRNRSLGDFKFRRQHPLEPFNLDFYCHEHRLAIELDGGQHNTSVGRRTDERRTAAIKEHGIRILRFWNHEVLQDTETVLEAIWNGLHFPGVFLTPNPSPKGRGEKAGGPILRVDVTKLRMDQFSEADLDEYLDSGQWKGKAGSFGYQDRLGWVHIVEGSESNVVGLPMELLGQMLAELNG